MDELITTAQAAKLAGVGVSSIKRWADQRLIRVTRTPGGHRRVLRSDLLRFLESGTNGNGQEHGTSGVRSDDLARYWADTVLGSEFHGLQGALLEARGRLGSWHATSDEVALGLREIGRRWMAGSLTALEEHVATEQLSRGLAALTETLPHSPSDPTALLTCVQGDAHTLGLSFLQICLREAHWGTLWVGAATPEEELCQVAQSGRVQMVALSASPVSTDAAYLAGLADRVGKACQVSGAALVLGGAGAWPEAPARGFRFRSFSTFSAFLRSEL
jgi:excisionase family DNA binding protein